MRDRCMGRQFAPLWVVVCMGACTVAARAEGAPPPVAPAAQAEEAVPRFDVMAYNITGNTKLSADEIERLVYPYLGPGKTFADINAAQAALEKAYQARGFLSVVVNLPQQNVNSGEITLEVIESRVETLNVRNAQYTRPSVIRQGLPELAPGTVPDFNVVQQQLAQVQGGAGQPGITPEIKPRPDDPRRMDVTLLVEDKPAWHASIEANTKQSYNTQRGRLEASASYDNLFQRGHTIGLNWFYSPWRPEEANTISMAYSLPVQRSARLGDDRLSMSVVHSNSNTPTAIGGGTVVRGETYGLRYRMPLPGFGTSVSHGWTLGLDYIYNRSTNQDIAGFTTKRPDLRYPAFDIGYDFYRSTDASRTMASAEIKLGASGLGGRTVDCQGVARDQFDCSRVGATPDFQLLKLNLRHERRIFGTWTLLLDGQAQFASAPLASPEQIGFGGLDSVRGYYEYEQTADQGLALRTELGTPTLFSWGDATVTGFAFLDRAELSTIDPLPTELKRIHMGSWGLGFKLEIPNRLQASLNFALPTFDTRKADSTGNQNLIATGRRANEKHRVDLSIKQSF
ncbi:MAG: ShlB/FhaC/HecB family hemolysin secretion/activation protein [Aquabacterium sp.]|nr:MAG: ShlB/FhaC/HecB family hemolysin secretion/activation protein [Aquabacterium sp.]